MTQAIQIDQAQRVGELSIVNPDGTRVACDLVLMKEWKTRLPKKFQTRGLPNPPAGASRGSPPRAGA